MISLPSLGSIIIISSGAVIIIIVVLLVRFFRSMFKSPDYSALPPFYPFKSGKAEKEYLDYYDRRSRDWPSPVEARYFETSFGKTWVTICGQKNAPPLVLLPSGFASSLIWQPNSHGLANYFRIYAVDNIYDVGRSVNTQAIRKVEDLCAWLNELLTVLDCESRCNLMGLSFGGWLAVQYALRHQERLHKLVLVAPVASVIPLPAQWAWRALIGSLPPHRFFMNQFLVTWMCQDLVKKNDEISKRQLDYWLNDALKAFKCFSFRMPVNPTVLSDEQWQSLQLPVLFLVGEHEVIYPAHDALERLHHVAPAIRTELIPNASHDVTISQTGTINDLVRSFLLQ
ncbi:alpha/beta hydrolase [bacterium]|nr:alpha/beta hydrolase [bacterium]